MIRSLEARAIPAGDTEISDGTNISRSEGRSLFGLDGAGYDSARPPYPDEIYEILQDRCDLTTGTSTLEIGAGSGQATRELVARGSDPVVAIEPDNALAECIPESLGNARGRVQVIVASLEEADLPSNRFDLAAAATSFHWVEPEIGHRKVHDALVPGGAWAMWWNVFGDPERDDAFHDATDHLMAPLNRSPSNAHEGRLPFALDVDRRTAELATAGFTEIEHTAIRWSLFLNSVQVRALYGTFSSVNVLPADDRERLLDAIAEIALTQFSNRVERNLVSGIYTSRKPVV